MLRGVSSVAVPFFAVAAIFVLAELLFSHKTKSNLYSKQDTLCNLLIFIGASLSQPLFLGYNVLILKSMERFALFEMPNTLVNTVLCIVLTDLAYYLDHRISHKFSLLWFFHEVHHSSKTFNLTTSFRLHWLSRLTAPVIFAPLILTGFKAEQVAIFFAANLIYQFFLHTKTIGQLGFIEGIFNTPSTHRVHHARNPIYIDKNFGGILIIWDRLFKTYQAETVEPEFGITGNFTSYNPLTVQFHKAPGYSTIANLMQRHLQTLKKNSNISAAKKLLSILMVALSFSTITNQTALASDTSNVYLVSSSSHEPLQGFVQSNDASQIEVAKPPDDITGLWKAKIIEFGRNPKVIIAEQNGEQFSGTYCGLLEKFPLNGRYDASSGQVEINVDFSESRLARRRVNNQRAVATISGTIRDSKITGTVSFPEMPDKMVHFEASKQN